MTSREEALLAEIADLVETIQDHVERMVAIKRIQELEVDNVLMRVRKLMEKSAVLKYVHQEEQASAHKQVAAEVAAPAAIKEPETAAPETVRSQMEAALRASQEAMAMAQSLTSASVQPAAEAPAEPAAPAPEPVVVQEPEAVVPVAAEPEASQPEPAAAPEPPIVEEELPPMPASVAEAAPMPESVPEFVDATADEEPEIDTTAFEVPAADIVAEPVEPVHEPVAAPEPEPIVEEPVAEEQVAPEPVSTPEESQAPEAEIDEPAEAPAEPAPNFSGLNFGMPAASVPEPALEEEEPAAEAPQPDVDVHALQNDFRSLDVAGDGVSVNDAMAASDGGDLASKLQKQPIADLKASIGLNEKFQFINELFGGNPEAFNHAVEEFNNLSGMDEARELLQSRGLNTSNPEALQSFTELLERRYA